MKNNFAFVSLSLGAVFFHGTPLNAQERTDRKTQPNVLFICVDDLRRELGCYGSPAITPYLDHLAAEGSLFTHHYVQVPTSGASRVSMLTGRLPRSVSDLSNEACQRRLSNRPEEEMPETLFHHMRRNGYHTVGIGKISHSADGYLYGYTEQPSDVRELPYSWDELLFDAGKWGTGWNAFFGYSSGTNRQREARHVPPYECANVPDEGLPDGITARIAVTKLIELATERRAGGKPFCLAVGFFKPHLPFTAPKKYWDLYDPAQIPLSPAPDLPIACESASLHGSGEFNGYLAGEEKASLQHSLSDAYARKIRQAYLACISYVDAQIGKLLDALKKSGEAERTIVVVWGDHGWHLGDLRVWGKHTLFDTALGSTLIIRAPGYRSGVKNSRIVSSVDIYPSLMELCGISLPEKLDGHSFVALLNRPNNQAWRDVAYSYFNQGVSLRTKHYRLNRYFRDRDWHTELYRYDQKILFERENIASGHKKELRRLMPLWKEGVLFPY